MAIKLSKSQENVRVGMDIIINTLYLHNKDLAIKVIESLDNVVEVKINHRKFPFQEVLKEWRSAYLE